MCEREMDGALFKTLLESGCRSLKANVRRLNDLNVFPIPDGDTGDNMLKTLYGGFLAIKDAEDPLGALAENAARGMLLSARGNSGVILSQMFAGIAKGMQGVSQADAPTLMGAFSEGVKSAYAAVPEPVEGTMLTVMREAVGHASRCEEARESLPQFFTEYANGMEASLKRTPELLPVLKEANVIDSGGAGLLCVAQGFVRAISGGMPEEEEPSAAEETAAADLSAFDENSVMIYGYCTEFLLQLTHAKTDIPAFSLESFKRRLAGMGDSIVAVQTGTIVKIHIHTLSPGAILQYAQTFGEFLTVKIENMTLQHHETALREKTEFERIAKRRKNAVVAVANGTGVKAAFRELGADIVIDDCAGNTPSTELFLKAFDAVNADRIFVLPDNGNFLMPAQEAAKLYQDSDVRILPAKNVGDGYAALAALDFSSDDGDEIEGNLKEEIEDSVSATVARSVRDVNMDAVCVKKGEYIGFADKKILTASDDKVETAVELAEKLGAGEKNFIVAFYGREVTEEEKSTFGRRVAEKFPDAEFYELDGGQELYDFVLVLQ